MAPRTHSYRVELAWTGDRGEGARTYRGYDRAHRLSAPGKPDIPGSSDPAFLGDRSRWNPEELLVGALAACHQLWYLHLCVEAGLTVLGYEDSATGAMREAADGSGRFTEVVLRPRVRIAAGSDVAVARALHARAHEMCFLASSMAFPVRHEPTVETADAC